MERAMQQELDATYPVTEAHVAFFQAQGYVRLPAVFSASLLARVGPRIARLVQAHQDRQPALAKRNTYGQAFLQVGNLWRRDEGIRAFCLSTRLGALAAALLQVAGVRMYHDQALFKEPGGGFTPWHADQHYWPLSNDNTVTAWIPLQDVPAEMGPLAFCQGSHRLRQNRHLAISDESERRIGRSLQDYPVDAAPYALGDVSFHRGWTFHRAGPNRTARMRAVMTVIMMEDGIRVIEPQRPAHANDWQAFMPGIGIGEVAASPLNPLIYARANDTESAVASGCRPA